MNIKSSVAVACFLPGRAKDLSAPLYYAKVAHTHRTVSCLFNKTYVPELSYTYETIIQSVAGVT